MWGTSGPHYLGVEVRMMKEDDCGYGSVGGREKRTAWEHPACVGVWEGVGVCVNGCGVVSARVCGIGNERENAWGSVRENA